MRHRMDELAVLPIFFKLQGRPVLLAGGSEAAAWKAELLSAAGAMVRSVAPDPCAALAELAGAPARGPVELIRRAWEAGDFTGTALAIGAIEDDEEAARFRQAAQAAGVPVNVIDRPAFCDFQFGTVVGRSPLVIGISTDGAAPVFGQALRTRIEAVLPQSVGEWARAARDWRPRLQAQNPSFRARRRFWEIVSAAALSGDEPPSETVFETALTEALSIDLAQPKSRLTMICAGPGDPNQVTLEAVGALQDADVVLYDPDVEPRVVGYARREAERRVADGSPMDLFAPQKPLSGRRVAWLGAGDPKRCQRWREREATLASLPFEISKVSGLGLCPDCTPGRPCWPAGERSGS